MSSEASNVRLLSEDEWEIVRDIRLRSLKTNPEAFGGKYNEESLWNESQWRELFIKNDFLVAFVNGKSAGVLFIEVLNGDHGASCWIGGCWVDPEFRGKKIFSAIFAYLDARAAEKGWERQGLGVWTHNHSAIKAYEALGFTKAGEDMPSTSQPGNFYMHMVRDTKN